MRRAHDAFAKFPNERLFQVLSEGIPLISANAAGYDAAARQLHQQGDHHASEVLRGIAAEEAAKALILMDLVRCPRGVPERVKQAKRFGGHLAKRIYAEMSSYFRIWSFGELERAVELDCRPYYLDGPNQVDWIFRNAILEKREEVLYVDFIQGLTEETDTYEWRVPPDSRARWRLFGSDVYRTSDCVQLVQDLLTVGACSAEGLAVLADLWRDYRPEPDSTRKQLREWIRQTLDRLADLGLSGGNAPAAERIVRHWQFPMWSIPMREFHRQSGDLSQLREQRQRAIRHIEEIEAVRDPAPAISREKVEALSDAHRAWQRDVDRRARQTAPASGAGGLRIRSGADLDDDFSLSSYRQVAELWRALTEEERASLLALAWFTRGPIADWARTYRQAVDGAPTLDEHYHIGLGHHWLAGLERWEESPKPFEAGRWYSP